MPINPNVIQNIQPLQLENPLLNMLRLAQLQQLGNENDMAPVKLEAAKLSLDKSKQINALLPQLFNGGNSSGGDQGRRVQTALSQGAEVGDIGPTVTNENRLAALLQTSAPSSPTGFNLGTLNKLAALGYDTKQLFDQYKYATDGVKRDANAYYSNPITGETSYYADPKSGFTIDPKTNTVSALPGFAGANASVKGAETRATEAEKAKFQLLPTIYVGQSGRPVGGSVYEYLNQQPQQPTAGAQGGGVKANVDWDALQGYIDKVKGSGDPKQISSFRNSVLAKLGDITDPGDRSRAISDFLDHMDAPAGTPYNHPSNPAISGAGGRPVLQSEAEKKQQLGQIDLSQGAQGEVNKNWISNVHTPVVKAANDAQGLIENLATLRNINPQTGWGSEAQAQAANVLVGLGIGGKQAEKMATDYQKFQSVAMEKLWQTLNAAKGPQTEGDADRAKSTFAQYANTGQANQFIMDVLQAKANQDIKRGQYYQEALPLAIQSGDLTRVDREWNKIQPSIWSDPILQKYVKKGGK